MEKITVLFARSDSVYKTLPGCDIWDIERDATKWNGNDPVICHPPCRAWGRLRTFAKPRPGEKELAIYSIDLVRNNGGVLEHPYGSLLWREQNLPPPGKRDLFNGFTFPISQHWFGHRAEKKSLLYICGISPKEIPDFPICLDYPTHVVQSRKKNSLPHISKPEREHTPKLFAEWLVEPGKAYSKKKGIKMPNLNNSLPIPSGLRRCYWDSEYIASQPFCITSRLTDQEAKELAEFEELKFWERSEQMKETLSLQAYLEIEEMLESETQAETLKASAGFRLPIDIILDQELAKIKAENGLDSITSKLSPQLRHLSSLKPFNFLTR